VDETQSRAFWNPDGYAELTLMGTASGRDLRELVGQARAILAQHGPAGGLIDGRQGNIVRNVETLSVLRQIGEIDNLQRLVILTTKDNPAGIRGPTVVMSMLTSVLGFRPLYTSDEAEARKRAAEK
jgi:hypothetical protein